MIYFGKIQFFYLPEFKISRSCPHWYIDTHCRIFENTYVFRIYFVYVSFYFVYGHPPHPAQSVICLGFGSFVGIVSWIRLLLLLKGGEEKEEEELKVWGAFINQLTHHL